KFSKKWSIGSKTKKFNSFEITKNNIFIGNDDGSIGVYDQNSTKNELKPTLKNYLDHHSDRISKLSSFSPKTFVSASHDNSIAIWDKSDKFDLRKSLKPHSDKITGLSIQPMRRHFATCSYDKTWAFIDLEYAKKLRNSEKQESELICISFHPDGLIFGAGSNGGALKMWDIKSQSDVATFEHGKTSVTAIAFSENGYYLASGGSDGVVRLWDLRKSDTIAKLPKLSSAVDDVVFDPFGGYLAVCGDFGLSLYTSKKWESVKNLNKKGAIAINFDEDRLTAIQKNGSGLISYAV
ncbi:Pre-mRNA-processing factor 19, partial [Bonamia ostreae]